MSKVNVDELRSEIEEERAWRERELRILRNQLQLLASEDERRIARKALVVMLYAHFEGTFKSILSIYINKLNSLNLTVSRVDCSLGAASLFDVFHALRDPNRKCDEFRKELPDDSALHRFARDKEFIEIAWTIATRPLRLDPDVVVDTESNLKPVVLRKILFRLGLDPKLAKPWEGSINQLLNRRNDVAHGTAKAGLDERDYANLEQAVVLVIDELVRTLTAVVANEEYLAPI